METLSCFKSLKLTNVCSVYSQQKVSNRLLYHKIFDRLCNVPLDLKPYSRMV